MKVLVKKDFLLQFFKLAAFVSTEKKTGSLLVGSHILLIVKQSMLTLVATDLEQELIIEESLATVEQEGSLVIPFRKIIEICKAMPDNIDLELSIEPNAKKLNIKSNECGFFAINYRDPEEFPLLNQAIFYTDFSLQSRLLKDLISKTAFAMGEDDSRPFLNGVFLSCSNKEAVSVATDGHRLSVFETDITRIDNDNQPIIGLSAAIKILLPRKSVVDLVKILAESLSESWVKVYVGENHARFLIGKITFTSKLLAGAFPPYQKLIPAGSKTVIANKDLLKSCLLRAAALLGDRSQGVKLLLSNNNLQMTARTENDDIVQENLTVNYSGEPLEICFNIKYLLDFLSNVDGEQISVKLENAVSGVLLQDQLLKSSYVLMPMQLC